MNLIVAPLAPGAEGDAVRDLQDALMACLSRGVLLAGDPSAVEMATWLRRERAAGVFSDLTQKVLTIFQENNNLPATGLVDGATAKALNSCQRARDELDGELAAPIQSIVAGVVAPALDGSNQQVAGLTVRAFHAEADRTIRLGQDTTDGEGRYTIAYTPLLGVPSVNLLVSVEGGNAESWVESELIRGAKPLEIVDLIVPPSASAAKKCLEGRIMLEYGLPAEQLGLRLYRRDFGGRFTRLDETTTATDGSYALAFDGESNDLSLEIRAVRVDRTEVVLSRPLNDLTTETAKHLNLLAPSNLQPLGAEYTRLMAALLPHVAKQNRLKEAKENSEQQDLALLNRATGWDARLIALASVSEQLAADSEIGLRSEVIYGLLRAGLPSDKMLLAQVAPDVVEMAIHKVRNAGIVAMDDAEVLAVKAQFERFATATRLNLPAPGSRSTYADLIKSSGLSESAQEKFARVYLRHQGDASQLWEEARKAGLEDQDVNQLQLQGKLAFLARNSAAVTSRLISKGLQDPSALVEQDLHDAANWKTELFELAGIPPERWTQPTPADRQKLAELIPEGYASEKLEGQIEAYAEDMARKVRMSYPTQVMVRLLETDPRFQLSSAHNASIQLLRNATAQGYRMGEIPLTRFLQSRADIDEGLSETEFREAGEQLKMVQRLYQITPCNEAIPVLMALGITSAFDVTAYPKEHFISAFNAKYVELNGKPAPAGVAELVQSKTKQVSSVTINLFAVAKKLDSEPAVAGLSAPAPLRESIKNELIKHYPTMESLFGSMDYCECEHCRSVLSPAAYLVDLLQFIDTEPGVWANFTETWKATHAGSDYLATWVKKPDGTPRTPTERKPYDALIERRPDLPHIALTCENTHTTLPYIDIVNEILEYYVANDKLEQGAARNTDDASTAELLAEPQNVIREAYDRLRQARYPLNLPFDRWQETIRRFCDDVETPLHRVLDVLRPDEVLVAAIQNPTNTGNATLSVANSDALQLRAGMNCTYGVRNSTILNGETKRIAAIGAADSAGTGQTTISLVGTWATSPAVGDRLVARLIDRHTAICMESLGLSAVDIEILVDPNPLARWHELYGCVATSGVGTTEVKDASTRQQLVLSSAKALSRRLGVTYKELMEIVKCEFVNPELSTLTLLYKLGVSVRDAKLYKAERAFYAANKDLIGVDRSGLPLADQQRYDNLANNHANRAITGWQVLGEVEAFQQRLQNLANAFTPPLNPGELQAAIAAIPFEQVLVLADPDTGCNFDQTTLQYADGTKADAVVFLRINLFVRLWRRLGWSIEETDRALTTFVPQSAPFDAKTENLSQQPLKTALIYLAHLKALDEQLRLGKQSRLKLLTFWSNIATTGKKSLYAQLFLNRGVLMAAPVFDHPLGQFLSNPTIKLKAHGLTLQGALGLSADEIGSILSDAGLVLETATLSLANVSLLYRFSLLAKALKLPVRDLIALKQLSGLNPFAPLHPDPIRSLDQDHPFVQTLEFIKVAEEVKASGLKVEDLDYLLRHRFEATGKYRSNQEAVLSLLKSLSGGIRAIRAAHAVPDAAHALGEDELRQKLALVLSADVVDRFLAMVNTSVEFTATQGGVNPADKFKGEDFATEQRLHQISYKEVPRQEQSLSVRGVLLDTDKAAIRTRLDPKLSTGQKQRLAELLDQLEQQARTFFENHLKQQKLRLEGETGFLQDGDFKVLFAPLKPPLPISADEPPEQVTSKRKQNQDIEAENQKELQSRRHRIGQAFLPMLQQRLIRQFIVEKMAAHTDVELALIENLVNDERLLLNPAAASPAAASPAMASPEALIHVFAATGKHGLDATFWASGDSSGAPLTSISMVEANTGLRDADGNPLMPLGANSARLEGYLEVPTSGAYRFEIRLGQLNTRAELRFPHRPDPILVTGTATTANTSLGDQPDAYLELKAGLLYRFSLELQQLNGGGVELLVQGETLPKGPLSQFTLYSAAAIETAESAAMLLNKALQMVQSLGLNEREIRYLLTHADDFDAVSLSQLPTSRVGDSAVERSSTAQQFKAFRRLAAYGRLKRELAGGTDDLIDVFEANGTTAPDRLETTIYPAIAKLSRRNPATVKACAEALVSAPALPSFANEVPLLRLWEALQVVERFGVPPATLLGWWDLVNAASSDERRHQLARVAKEAIKSRFEPEIWQRVAQPIFDKLRQQQRDALVSHIMHRHGFERLEQLYEYFLVDPGMEPMVQTSRIRLAIASLQLFIQRSLLNMEEKVHPSCIHANQWEWMKRYRVWEANRKIFLYPENWLEPEFRDNKTHLFAELEGALLQGDVSSDLVEDAFLNYLRKLDELARLDICAMHIEDHGEPALRTLHVIGRTSNQPHKYFYRRYAHQMWTAWEPVTAEIEGDHLAPVVWRDRLYLFWVTFLEKAQQPTGDTNIPDPTQGITLPAVKRDVEAHLHWSEYIDGQWTTRESSNFMAEAAVMARGLTSFDPKSVFVHVTKEMDAEGKEQGVFVHLQQTYTSTLNSNSLPQYLFLRPDQSIPQSGDIAKLIQLAEFPQPFQGAFYLAGRNSTPELGAYANRPDNPFSSATSGMANRYRGNGSLTVSFKEHIITGSSQPSPAANPDILKKSLQPGGSYTILPSDNNLMPLGISEDAYRNAINPDAVKAAIKSGLGEVATLIRPVFYQDNQHTFFIEPELTERTIEQWDDYVSRPSTNEPFWRDPGWLDNIGVIAEIPRKGPIPDPGDPMAAGIHPGSLINPAPVRDWLVNPGSAFKFGDVLIGPTGQPGLELHEGADPASGVGSIHTSPGSELASGVRLVMSDAPALFRSGLRENGGGLNIIGAAGLNTALADNVANQGRSAAMPARAATF